MTVKDHTRSRLLILIRDATRWPYNVTGDWLLRQRLAWRYRWARFKHRATRTAGPPASPPPICGSLFSEQLRAGHGTEAGQDRFIPIFPAGRVGRPAANTIAGVRQPWRLHRFHNTLCPPAYVACIANGQYHAPMHDIFSAGGCLLPEFSFYGLENRLWESREYEKRYARGLPPAQHWPGATAAVAAIYANTNYFHWMFQELPRLELLRLAGVKPEQIDRYVLNPPRLPFHTETLAQMGIPLEKVVATGPDVHFTADTLWTTSSLRYSGHTNRWVHEFLRREFGPKPAPARGGERLFISRADVTLRGLANEPEVIARLAGLGFRSVTPGQLSVAEQAAVFAGAEVVVAPHGAGLANLVFTRPGTKVLELLSPGRRGGAYWELSNACHLEYYYLIGDDNSSARDKQGFRVPLARLNALLEIAGVR